MDQQDALNHAPDSPQWGNLPHYRMVEYPNIDVGKYYYYKNGRYPYDFIVFVSDKFNNRVKAESFYWRKSTHWGQGQDAIYEEPWEPVGYVAYFTVLIIDMNDQAVGGARRFYAYNEDVEMQNGGGLIENINARLDDPSYILPAGTAVHRAVPMMRMTPPFFPRKSLRQGRKNRRRASPSSYKRHRSTRKAKKQTRLSRRRY